MLGRIAFILAIVAVGLAVVQQLLGAFLPLIVDTTQASYSTIAVYLAIGTIIHTLVSVAALVVGIAGTRNPGDRLLSGIGIGVGAAGVIAGVVGLVVIPFASFLA